MSANKRSCCNSFLFFIYKFLRFLYVSIWFYYLPVIVMAFGYLWPLWNNWLCKHELSGKRLISGQCIDPLTYSGSPL